MKKSRTDVSSGEPRDKAQGRDERRRGRHDAAAASNEHHPNDTMKKQAPDAIDLLDADHLAIHAQFQAYRELVQSRAPALQRRSLAEEICIELTIHARLEEELFYPAVREALQDDDLVDDEEDPHGTQREFVAQILATAPEDPLYDAKVALLGEHVLRHVRQEREQVFNRVLAARVDLQSLGRLMSVRKEELRAVSEALREEALASALA
jgi:hypothetical protein